MVRAAGYHQDFHRLIEQASKNEYLEPAMAPLHLTEMVFSMLVGVRGVAGWDEHDQIVDAIDRDVDEARSSTTWRGDERPVAQFSARHDVSRFIPLG
jgi:DNA-binding GntR family transcriptional regulator